MAKRDSLVCDQRRCCHALPQRALFVSYPISSRVPFTTFPLTLRLKTPSPASIHSTIPSQVKDIRDSFGAVINRAMRVPVDAMEDLVKLLSHRKTGRGLSPACRTGVASRYLGGGSYVDVRAALEFNPATVHCAVWEALDALHSTPYFAFEFTLGRCPRRLVYAGAFQSRRCSPVINVVGALDTVTLQQKQPLGRYARRREWRTGYFVAGRLTIRFLHLIRAHITTICSPRWICPNIFRFSRCLRAMGARTAHGVSDKRGPSAYV